MKCNKEEPMKWMTIKDFRLLERCLTQNKRELSPPLTDRRSVFAWVWGGAAGPTALAPGTFVE